MRSRKANKVTDWKRTLALKRRATLALRAAVRKAYAEHAKLGLPMYVWRNGKVVAIFPSHNGKKSSGRA
jgi:hypothetical protein